MKRLHLGRIAGSVAAAALALGMANFDAVSLMAAEATQTDMTLHDGQVQVDLERIGAFSAIRVPDLGVTSRIGRCAFDVTRGQRNCQWSGADNRFSATSFAIRSRDGAAQLHFDSTTTDSVTIRTAVLNQWNDKANHAFDINLRSTQQFSGLSRASQVRVLNGADTSFRTKRWGNRFATRVERTTTYSGVTIPNDDESAYPTGGVIHSSSRDTYGALTAPRDAYSSVTVYFDGTRTPDAYINGTRYTLDLSSGIATPAPAK